jgi:hypothetical protein
MLDLNPGTGTSNPFLSSGESANHRSLSGGNEGAEGLQLHHLYRTMAWLGEPLADQTGASELAPRWRKDVVEGGSMRD